MDRKKRVFTWGFGGYGRLGHGEQKDEWVPRLVAMFNGPNRGCADIAAGSSYSLAVNELGKMQPITAIIFGSAELYMNLHRTDRNMWSYKVTETHMWSNRGSILNRKRFVLVKFYI